MQTRAAGPGLLESILYLTRPLAVLQNMISGVLPRRGPTAKQTPLCRSRVAGPVLARRHFRTCVPFGSAQKNSTRSQSPQSYTRLTMRQTYHRKRSPSLVKGGHRPAPPRQLNQAPLCRSPSPGQCHYSRGGYHVLKVREPLGSVPIFN